MEVSGKIKRICEKETLTFKDGRTYTQQVIILDCGQYSPTTGDYYENNLAFYFGERNLGQLATAHEGAKVTISFGMKGSLYNYQDKQDPTKQREGYKVRLNAYALRVDEPSELVRAAQQSVQQPQQYQQPQPMQTAAPVPTYQTQPMQRYPTAGAQNPLSGQPQQGQGTTDDLPF